MSTPQTCSSTSTTSRRSSSVSRPRSSATNSGERRPEPMTHVKISMAQALNQALRDAMKADDTVLMFGEDVGALGGVFRITDGLTKEFGENRCFDTPLAEAGIVGMAV